MRADLPARSGPKTKIVLVKAGLDPGEGGGEEPGECTREEEEVEEERRFLQCIGMREFG